MRVLRGIEKISNEMGVGRQKAEELINLKIIPVINEGGSQRPMAYTTDTIVQYMAKKVYNGMNLDVDTTKEIFLSKIDTNIINKPNICEVVICGNTKGGVGKTTTAVNLAVNLAIMGKRVLLLDMDGQANATKYVTENYNRKLYDGSSLTDLFELFISDNRRKNITAEETKKYIHTIEMRNVSLDLLPSTFNLARKLEVCRSIPYSHNLLKKITKSIEKDYDYIIVDNPPQPGMALQMSLFAGTRVFVVTTGGEFSTDAAEELLDEISDMETDIIEAGGTALNIDGILLNDVQSTVVHQDGYDIMKAKAKELNIKLYECKRSILFEESAKFKIPLSFYKPRSKEDAFLVQEGILDYMIDLLSSVDENNKK